MSSLPVATKLMVEPAGLVASAVMVSGTDTVGGMVSLTTTPKPTVIGSPPSGFGTSTRTALVPGVSMVTDLMFGRVAGVVGGLDVVDEHLGVGCQRAADDDGDVVGAVEGAVGGCGCRTR